MTVEELVVLLDDDGRPSGQLAKSAVHHAATPLHLAFSLYLQDRDGRVLMTRRALTKQTWPGVWTNTCCGHPRLHESFPDAISRRLSDELGLAVADPRCVLPEFRYRARDASGVLENEVCPVFIGTIDSVIPVPNPGEVAEWTWTSWDNLSRAAALTPFAFSPWAVAQLAQLADLPKT